ncbi:MAG: translation initiation factor IF-2 N-terminal domain-containing protein [Oscillospiraceae bacterium]
MDKIRAYELSKAFGFPSKEIVKVLHDYKVSTKNHMSALDEHELDVIFEYYTQKNESEDFSLYEPKKEEVIETESENEMKNEEGSGIEIMPEMPVEEMEIGRKVRLVDTRADSVDLDRIDEDKIAEIIHEKI